MSRCSVLQDYRELKSEAVSVEGGMGIERMQVSAADGPTNRMSLSSPDRSASRDGCTCRWKLRGAALVAPSHGMPSHANASPRLGPSCVCVCVRADDCC